MHSGQAFPRTRLYILMDRRTRVANGDRGLYRGVSGERVPFWIPALNYYLLVFLLAAGVFLTVLGALYDGYDETPWIVSGMSAAAFAASLFLFREVVLRRFRRRTLAARRLSHQLRLAAPIKFGPNGNKLTLQRNEEILNDIRAKSEAAKVLVKLAEAHKEVFELCEQYLTMAASEISSARPGSPRIPALRKGSRFAGGRHRFHMLKWAEIKAHSFTSEAGNSGRLSDKIESAQQALDAVDLAMDVYPDEPALVDSHAVLRVFLVSARIKNSIQKAERASERGNNRKAVDHYREALSDLQNCDIEFSEREVMFERIQTEIGRISKSADV